MKTKVLRMGQHVKIREWFICLFSLLHIHHLSGSVWFVKEIRNRNAEIMKGFCFSWGRPSFNLGISYGSSSIFKNKPWASWQGLAQRFVVNRWHLKEIDIGAIEYRPRGKQSQSCVPLYINHRWEVSLLISPTISKLF